MARRRMFANAIITSAKFLRMPATSRLLYYDLGMAADDDGCVEAFSVMRMTGATEDDLRVLASKGFIKVLNADLVSYILDWNTNNQIRKDRYIEGMYKHLIDTACTVLLQDCDEVTTICQPNGNQMAPQYSIGKSSTVKFSTGEESIEGVAEATGPSKPTTKRFIPPTVEQVGEYCLERGNNVDPQRFVDHYTSNGWMVGKNKMKDWKAAVRTWEKNSNGNPKPQAKSSNPFLDMVGDGYE
jgi:hypothetical protein